MLKFRFQKTQLNNEINNQYEDKEKKEENKTWCICQLLAILWTIPIVLVGIVHDVARS